MGGPLAGVRLLELAGIGPGPFAGMMLADMGAEVIHIDRPGGNPGAGFGHGVLLRSRRSLALDLKAPGAAAVVLRMVQAADGLFEGFRPGVAERLGVGPTEVLAANPRAVYGRMTGWGQDGPLARAAGHDINYIALAGVLDAIGEPGRKPVVPINLVGDFGGGGMLLAFGMVCALLQAGRTGVGQVVDAAMVDGASALMAMSFGMRAQGLLGGGRGEHLLDGGAPFYDTYATSDGRWIALGPIEPQFFAELVRLLDLGPAEQLPEQLDVTRWPELRARIAGVIAGRTRAEWDERLLGTDVCYAPVLDLDEAAAAPHNRARGVHIDVGGMLQPAPAPRFSVDSPPAPRPAAAVGADTDSVLADLGFSTDEVDDLLGQGVIARSDDHSHRRQA